MVERSRTFGEVAEVYDRVRSGYPAQLVADVCAYVDRRTPDVIEVGAGTGKATVAFADHVGALHALEPDPAMADLLRRNTASRPTVQVVETSFEGMLPGRRFDLLISADAWHWTDPDRRWQLAIERLRPGGAIAIFSNFVVLTTPEQRAALATALTPHPHRGGHLDAPDVPTADVWPGTEMAKHPMLRDVAARHYKRRRVLPVGDFVDQLSTESTFRILDEAQRNRLFETVRAGLAAVGLDVRVTVHTLLHLARVSERLG